MNGLFMILFGICVARGIWALDEEQCSKYHYEQQILSKQIRMEIRIKTFENMIKEIQPEEVKTMCDDEWMPFRSSCYLFGRVNVDFQAAKSFCEISGGHLVRIQSSGENDFITRHVAEWSAPEFWVGLTDIVSEGVWKWTDTDENVRFFNWYNGEPGGGRNGNCVAISAVHSNEWIDVSCTNARFRPICKK